MENRNYIIFNVSEINLINFSDVLESSALTLRKSVDGTKTFVKWEGLEPACISDLATKEGPYNQAEMLTIMASAEWTVQQGQS